MNFIELLLVLICAGFACFLIQSAPFISAWFKLAATGLIAIAVVIWMLGALGFHTGMHFR